MALRTSGSFTPRRAIWRSTMSARAWAKSGFGIIPAMNPSGESFVPVDDA
jgi:hypothetical protein